jgi:hypothetical protein
MVRPTRGSSPNPTGKAIAVRERLARATKTTGYPPASISQPKPGEAIAAVRGAIAATSPNPRGNRVASDQAIQVSAPNPSPVRSLVTSRIVKSEAAAEPSVAKAMRTREP